MNLTKRQFLLQGLLGAGAVGLRALATGLPISLLANPRRALADDAAAGGCVSLPKAQYLILSTSGAGDPVNCNVPGTYDFDDVVHAKDPSMAKTPLMLGGQQTSAAQIWSTLPQRVLDRSCFFHNATYTNSHPNEPKVLRLMGATRAQESLPSIYAKALAGCLGTVQPQPLSIGAGSILTFEGRALPNLPPTALASVLAHPSGPLGHLVGLRDQTLDEINDILKESATSAQRAYLDELVVSRQQARAISTDLLDALAAIKTNDTEGQITAAVTLIRMNVAPVMVITVGFGGDNHADLDLMKHEVPEHATGVASIASLMSALEAAGMQDRVTFGMLNVFGRTLKSQGTVGRTHWANHHAGILIGSTVRAGVIGGIAPSNGDYAATAIDSRSGRGGDGGDIAASETLESFAKTMGTAIGVPRQTLDAAIGKGKVVEAALAT